MRNMITCFAQGLARVRLVPQDERICMEMGTAAALDMAQVYAVVGLICAIYAWREWLIRQALPS